jgi:hypothetical protein
MKATIKVFEHIYYVKFVITSNYLRKILLSLLKLLYCFDLKQTK